MRVKYCVGYFSQPWYQPFLSPTISPPANLGQLVKGKRRIPRRSGALSAGYLAVATSPSPQTSGVLICNVSGGSLSGFKNYRGMKWLVKGMVQLARRSNLLEDYLFILQLNEGSCVEHNSPDLDEA